MKEFETTVERIKKYLRDQMSAGEKVEFETDLANSPELKSLAQDIALLERTLQMDEAASDGHIDAEDLTALAEDEDSIPQSRRSELQRHTESCDSCREELAAIRQSIKNVQSYQMSRPSISSRFLNWLFPNYSPSRPVLSLVTLLVVLLPIAFLSVPAYLIIHGNQPGDTMVSCRLVPVSRSAENVNVISIDDDTEKIVLELDFPYPRDINLTYNILITDYSNKHIYELENLQREKLIATEVAAKYFDSGLYYVNVNELESDSTRRTIVFPLKVERSK